ncbi:hypothetical protein C1H76_9441 [Elsinoe australis]|uniref:Rhodopsin domain-containing protein n=1 Tax=Elsinoe australis TaxID=40998 RepID=A0A4U7AQC7_9PEZI|nr:hypothetical protein C1H76_9441 [Elsinoe australis]
MSAANFIKDTMNGLKEAQHITVAFVVIVIISLALRIWVRTRMIKQFGWDDWTMVLACVLYVTYSGVGYTICEMGIKSLTNPKIAAQLVPYTRASAALYSFVMIFLKISVALFFYKIFSHRPVQRIVIWIVAILTILSGLAYFGVGAFTCASAKTYKAITGKCKAQIPHEIIFAVFSCINIAGDIAFASMAVVALMTARLPAITKFTASLLILFGFFGGIATIIRLYWTLKPVTGLTYYSVSVNLGRWVAIELGASLAATNFGTIRPLFHAILEKLRLISTVREATYGTAGNVSGKHGTRRGTQNRPGTGLEADEIALVTNIKREVTVDVDEEKA